MENTAVKGVALVLAGILIGILVLAVALDEPVQVATASPTVEEDAETPDGEDDEEITTSTTEEFTVRSRALTKVVVANGAGIDGAAGIVTTQLAALGYNTLSARNASPVQSESHIYFLPGWGLEARELAQALNIVDDARLATLVEALPTNFRAAEIEDAKVVVVLGGPDELVPQDEES